MRLAIDVLGPLQARSDGTVDLTRPSHRRLLSILTLEAGRRISSERLIDRFWSEDPPPAAKAALQTHISALRRLLGDSAIVTEAHGYRLDLEPDSLDASRYEALAETARRAASSESWADTVTAIDRATDLWQGQPYSELIYDDFARPSITKLEETRLDLLELRAEALLSTGRHRDAIAELEGLVVEYPLRERFWEHLMTARLRSGRPTEALRAFQDVKDELARAGLEPSDRLRNLEERILLYGEGTPEKRSNLPNPIGGFIGRKVEKKQLEEAIGRNRLTTIAGAGGSGKTRIAIETASRLEPAFDDGVWFIDLATVEGSDSVLPEVTRVLRLQPDDREPLGYICTYLADKASLLIFDNAEHLLDSVVPTISAILESAPRVHIVATSREPLRLGGEAIVELSGMAIPSGPISFADALEYDAIELFDERARLARNRYSTSESNIADVIEICTALDGMPLAIELAAARIRSLEPSVIADRLDDRFELLRTRSSDSHPKQRALEATIDWSYQLLSTTEKALLENLSVFRGGFDHHMAEVVGVTDPSMKNGVLPSLADLADKSLITTYENADGRRFRLLESVRVFAFARLRETGRLSNVEEMMLVWASSFSEKVIEDRLGPRSSGMGQRISDEFENLSRAAEIAAQRSDLSASVGISLALSAHWQIAGYPSRGADELRRAMLFPSGDGEAAVLVRTWLADLVKFTDNDDSTKLAEDAYQMAVELPPSPIVSAAIRQAALNFLLSIDEDSTRSVVLSREAVAVAVACGDGFAELWSRRVLAKSLAWNGDHGEAANQLDLCGRLGKTTIPDPLYEGFRYSHQVLYSDPERRRDQPIVAMRDIEERFSDILLDWEAIRNHGIDEAMIWRTWVNCQAGDFDSADEAAAQYSSAYREGFSAMGQVIARTLTTWMRGDLEKAWAVVSEVDGEEISSRWYHDYFPLIADIAADRGDLNSARQAARRWLTEPVHSSEQSMKLGVLNPLTRAEVNQALRDSAATRSEHVEAARGHVAEMERILTHHPPLNGGSLSMETPLTHLAFARAEVSRVDRADPALWDEATNRADYLYFRLYGQIRLAESFSEIGDSSRAMSHLELALKHARKIGALHLVNLGEAITHRLGTSS